MAKEYNISKTAGACVSCQEKFQPEQEYMATVRVIDQPNEDEDQFAREDYCLECWNQRDNQDRDDELFGIWKAEVPKPREKKKTFVDDELLLSFFHRLGDTDDETKVSFRFVISLVLMRKKLLVYEKMEKRDDGVELWLMRLKGSQKIHRVIDPHMDEDKIAEVSGQLGSILEGDL
ncbi:MAG: hypothetical protein ACLFVU_04775 [Phycisphaerae bacterium]